jgi:RNA polymerase sigma factor (sigma-70 family)
MSALLSDERLTKRAVGGDPRAFAAIFDRYQDRLYGFCFSLLGNRHDAQDALQNTMVKALARLPGEQRRIELRPWLYRIAHNESVDLLRRRRPLSQLDPEWVGSDDGPPEEAARRQRLALLLVDLGQLPERQRGALVMRELGGLRFEQIGTALGVSAAAARQAVYEARLGLREMEVGREMGCAEAMRAISGGDRRVLRRRDIRAHLRGCGACRGLRDEVESRKRSFAALVPLPAAVAGAVLKGALGGSAGGTGLGSALGGGATTTVASSALMKGAATVAVIAAVGVGAADRGGLIRLGTGAQGGAAPAVARTPGPSPAQPGPAASGRGGRARSDVEGAGASSDSGSHELSGTGDAAAGGAAPAAADPAHKVDLAHEADHGSPVYEPNPEGSTPSGQGPSGGGETGGGPGGSASAEQAPEESTSEGEGDGENVQGEDDGDGPGAGTHPEHPPHPEHPEHPPHPEQASGDQD